MSTPLATRSIGRTWRDFWFSPADPTTLGFMRVVTGLLVIYVHLAYSFDLQAFFGENGWYRLDEINAERQQYPWTMASFTEWEDREAVIPGYLPEYPHRRKAMIKWYRELGQLPQAERRNALSYITRMQGYPNINAAREGLAYAQIIPFSPQAQTEYLLSVTDANARKRIAVPNFFDLLSDADRAGLKQDLEVFLSVLPKDPDERTYVLNHLTEIMHDQRRLLLTFLNDLPADEAKRSEQFDYLEKWNNEKRKANWLGEPIFSIWFHVTDPTEMAVAHAAILIIMVLFTLGLFTRVTSVLTWLAAVSYIHRTQQVLFGMDTMMNLLLIYLMFAPSGAALSLDRWRARKRAERLSRERNGGKLDALTERFLAQPPKSVSAGFVLRLVQIHFCFIYLAAGFSKLKGPAWWNHNAYWDTIANPEFTMIYFDFYYKALQALVHFRPVYQFVAAGGVIFTFFMEIGLPFLIWTRLRPYMMIGGVLFHFGIGMFMGLNLFGLLMMTLLLSYMPGEVIREQLFAKSEENPTPEPRATARRPG